MKQVTRKRKKNNYPSYRTVFLALCTVFLSIYPFICRLLLKKVPDDESIVFSTTNGYIVDLCNFSKEAALLGFAVFVLVFFLGEHIFPDEIEKINRNRLKSLRFPILCIGGYALFTVLSFCFSEYRETALWGSNQEYEGMLAILCYCLLFLFAVNYFKNEHSLKILTVGIISVSFLVAVLSVIEIFWKPLLEFTFIQNLVSSAKYRDIAHSIVCENFIGQISLFFHNPAYLGGFCTLFLPIVLGISLNDKGSSSSDNKLLHRLKQFLYIADPALLGLALFWSRSDVSYICVIFSLCLIIPLFLLRSNNSKSCRKNLRPLIIKIAVPAVLCIGLIIISENLPNSITYKHEQGLDSTLEKFSAETVSSKPDNRKIFRLSKATLDNGIITFESEDTVLHVSMDFNKFFLSHTSDDYGYENCLLFTDNDNQPVNFVPSEMRATSIMDSMSGFRLDDSRYDAIFFGFIDEVLVFDLGYEGTVEFYLTEMGIKVFGQGSNLLDHIPQPKVSGFENIYHFATGRGYTWAQGLAVLPDCLLLGNGNGTFAFYFVQNEITGLLNTHGSCKYVIDRPHNWYLQVAVSSGIPALILMLSAFLYYIIRFFNFVIKKKNRISPLLLGVFSGLLSFMIFGLINDSFITVFPYFWIFFGIGIGNLNEA